ncbi:MAG: PxKF domain-containing protein [Acidimicrobiales bacterium]
MRRWCSRFAAVLALAVFGFALPGTATAQVDDLVDNRPPPHPALGLDGAATMHGDSVSSDTTPLAGPGARPLQSTFANLGGVCTVVLIRHDGKPMTVCTAVGNQPQVRLLDRSSGATLAQVNLTPGGAFTGAYAFMDAQDRVIVSDGSYGLIRISATDGPGGWSLTAETVASLASQILPPASCVPVGTLCDTIIGLDPGVGDDVWFATRRGRVGYVDLGTGAIHSFQAPAGEVIANSISTTNDGRVGVASTRAVYLLTKNSLTGDVVVSWRAAYANAGVLKPGQLSIGSGTSPTFFGPGAGDEYLTIVDNAAPQENVVVFDAAADSGGRVVCSVPVFDAGLSATENSEIAIENTIITASTYGYPYPGLPPSPAGFHGGMARVDVNASGTGCDTVWTNTVRSAAVPKLSVPDQLVYTVERRNPAGGDALSATDTYSFLAIDVETGAVLSETLLGSDSTHNALQIAGTAGLDRDWWQGTTNGVEHVTPVPYGYSGLLQPVNGDGSSIFKLGSTVPLKLALTDPTGLPADGAVVTVSLAKVDNQVEGTFVEAVSTSAADVGNAFRSVGSGQYRFNLATNGLTSGTYVVRVLLDDGTIHDTLISLR